MTLLFILLGVVVLAAVGYVAAGFLLARAVIYPRRAAPTAIVAANQGSDSVVLSGNQLTRFSGTIGLLHDDETKLTVLAPGVEASGLDNVLRVLARPTDLQAGTDGRATGNIFTPDDVTDQVAEEVAIVTSQTDQPAWLYRGTGSAESTWIVHVHGMLAGRDSALRSVRAVDGAGYTSLVVSYRGDSEAPGERHQASTLGQTEWQDLDAALKFATDQGAATIVVVGWSLGATIALEQVQHGTYQDRVAGLVLVSPALSWNRTIRYSMGQQRVPNFLATAAIGMLTATPTARLLGLSSALHLPTALPLPTLPTLLLHSEGDRTTPYEASRELAEQSPLVDLVRFPACPHAMEWNADPEQFNRTLSTWVAALQEKGRSHPL